MQQKMLHLKKKKFVLDIFFSNIILFERIDTRETGTELYIAKKPIATDHILNSRFCRFIKY
jgi:hypothetical protein